MEGKPSPSGTVYLLEREVEERQRRDEILVFLQEALVDVDHLPREEAEGLEYAKLWAADFVAESDAFLEDLADPLSRCVLLSLLNEALVNAYELGNYSSPSKSVWELRRQMVTKNNVLPAIKARKKGRDKIQALINQLACKLWSTKPTFQTNSSGTAKEIQPAFNRTIRAWNTDDLPAEWMPCDASDSKAKAKEVERIRRRIRTIVNADN